MDTHELQKEIIDFVSRIGVAVAEASLSENSHGVTVTLRTEDPSPLIGHHGETLRALNHVFKKIIEQKHGENVPAFVIDVNGYGAHHAQLLEREAYTLAARARTFKHDIDMDPMNSYDRMLVHEALRDTDGITTESEGEDAFRHVVIRYRGHVLHEKPRTE